MSFRGRLRLFFALIVIVPMIALALVLFALTARSETGKADAGIAVAMRTAFAVHEETADRAEGVLRQVASDPELRAALIAGGGEQARLEELLGARRGIVRIELRYRGEGKVAVTGSPTGVAAKSAPLSVEGRPVGALAVSLTEASDFAQRVSKLTNHEVAVFRERRAIASTVEGVERAAFGDRGRAADLEVEGEEFRGRVDRIAEPSGSGVEIAVLRASSTVSARIADDRLLIGGLLLGFLLLALVSATFVSRALTGQIAKFLTAARQLARGDFTHPVPVEGRDEFAQLGREFNSMSVQLEAKIEEVERKREELEETIRRVGDALATGLDRNGVVALSVRTAVEACEADAGRAFPLDRGAFHEVHAGADGGDLEAAIESAERDAFAVRPEIGPELLEPIDPDAPPAPRRRAVRGAAAGAYALSIPMRGVLASPDPEYLGVLSIARRDRPFTSEEEELLEYLAGQAVVSIENAGLHETVERQAVTDELTGLANARAFHSTLEREIERSRRFQSPLGLVMLDIDDFKLVNDEYGHQQGDEVLASVASVLREFSRDIDAPARYGGEELAVVLPQTDSEGAALLAERMRGAIERTRVPRVGRRGALHVTASFGVAAVPESAAEKDALIAAVDAALYRAKRGGKNRVECAEPVPAAG